MAVPQWGNARPDCWTPHGGKQGILSTPVIRKSGRACLAGAAVAPAGGDERPEIVPVARFQRRTPRPWRGWRQARPDLTRVKSSKIQPQLRDWTSDSIKV